MRDDGVVFRLSDSLLSSSGHAACCGLALLGSRGLVPSHPRVGWRRLQMTARLASAAARCLLCVWILLQLWGTPALAESRGYGPVPVRNFQAVQLLFLGMYGDRAAVVPKRTLDVRVELAETANIFDEVSGSAKAQVKFETLRSALFFRYGLTDRLELSLEIPTIYRYRGFLEGTIEQVERLTTGLGGPRGRLDGTGFVFDVNSNAQTLFTGGDGQFGLGDLSLYAKWQALQERGYWPTAALRFGLKLPTGDDERVFGSGHVDLGLGLALEKTLATRWMAYVNVNGVFPTGEVSGLSLDPIFSSVTAVEYLWTPRFSLVLQFDYYSTPFSNTGLKMLDRGVTEVVAGFNYRLRDHILWQVYGVENVDFITDSAADFTLSTLVTYRFDSG